MAVKLIDIANKTGVSVGAISLVLKNPDHPRFAKATRRRILRMAEEMGYRPNRFARGLREGRTNTISLIIPWNSTQILDTAERLASAHGLRLILQFTPSPDPSRELAALQAAIDWRVDGLIWMPYGLPSAYRQMVDQLRRFDVAVSLLEQPLTYFSEANVVRVAYNQGIEQALRHLQEQGYERVIYHAHARRHHVLQRYRIACFRHHAKQFGINVGVHVFQRRTDNLRQDQFNDAMAFLSEVPDGSAILCNNDWDIFGLVEAARTLEKVIPDQIGMMSIGGACIGAGYRPIGDVMTPNISMLVRPSEALVEMAFYHMMRRICRDRGSESGAFAPVIPANVSNLIVHDKKRACADKHVDAGREVMVEMPLEIRRSTCLGADE